ncbi:helix-turn-helix domain-containing protein [Gemella haemolysans]|uniref:DNA-binding helix-turn-helix protein n=1 Tax=Gemella haemolysans ATCC 10379 TaxID=546270 RepID=C5NUN8_9BACL|nr:helix-turn-helix domain-containing protein [Gemella haemolysans]EER69103.1 DNA-binding helix-turn-helix protein [Gemella haemolysans ATCC 10379]KAA8708100.1 XRE family transcriptional regulator [Gemella haemolysans]UBH82075.1 XRE family transcriptional regulator [Gemella haemolysans]VEI38007.1 Uncharacterised protein [Gemella haemolysans]
MKIIINKIAVGQRIRQIRINGGYTYDKFGDFFGASRGNIQAWEYGKALPNKERLANISKMAGITVNELLHGSIDEFLENNIEVLLTNSKYPFKEILENYNLKEAVLIYIDNLNTVNKEKITINEIDKIEKSFNEVLEGIIKTIIDYYERVTDIVNNNKEITQKVLRYYFHDKSDVFNREIYDKKLTFMEYVYTLDDFIEFIISDNLENKIKFLYHIKQIEILIEKEFDGYFLSIKTTLNTFSLSRLLTVNTDFGESLHPYVNFAQGTDMTVVELKANKYKIDDFKNITGLYIESEDTLYYLAHYRSIEKVPLNTEAQYFILNHDNSYFISKITEKPDCKYLAPILGKME